MYSKHFIFSRELTEAKVTSRQRGQLYDISATATLEALKEPEEFSCNLRIPEANYTVRRETVIYPGECLCGITKRNPRICVPHANLFFITLIFKHRKRYCFIWKYSTILVSSCVLTFILLKENLWFTNKIISLPNVNWIIFICWLHFYQIKVSTKKYFCNNNTKKKSFYLYYKSESQNVLVSA